VPQPRDADAVTNGDTGERIRHTHHLGDYLVTRNYPATVDR
jgi:hypothetical protein